MMQERISKKEDQLNKSFSNNQNHSDTVQKAGFKDQRQEKKDVDKILQLAKSTVTNSKQETHDVWTKNDILNDLQPAFNNWKRGNQDTSGHAASQAKKLLSSEYNRLVQIWMRKNDKTMTPGKTAITFSTDKSLSGGAGVKSLKASVVENSKYYSFVWHVRVVPD